jgi:hypothetical protein
VEEVGMSLHGDDEGALGRESEAKGVVEGRGSQPGADMKITSLLRADDRSMEGWN